MYVHQCPILRRLNIVLTHLTLRDGLGPVRQASWTLFKPFYQPVFTQLIQLQHLLCYVVFLSRPHLFHRSDVLLTRLRSTAVMPPSTSLSAGKNSYAEKRADSGAKRNPTESMPSPSSSAGRHLVNVRSQTDPAFRCCSDCWQGRT